MSNPADYASRQLCRFIYYEMSKFFFLVLIFCTLVEEPAHVWLAVLCVVWIFSYILEVSTLTIAAIVVTIITIFNMLLLLRTFGQYTG